MQSRTRKMTYRELAAIINNQIADSKLYEDSQLAADRRKALLYFKGDTELGGDVPTRENRSSLVSHDLSDVHGWIMPSLLRVFLGSDRVVLYEPRRKDAEQAAQQATDYINYLFFSECDGYAVLHSAIWDALTFGNGIVKHWWDDTPEYRTETKLNLTEQQYLDIISDPDVEEIIEHTEKDDPSFYAMPQLEYSGGMMQDAGMMPGGSMMPAGGMMMQDPALAELFSFGPPKLHDIKVKRKVSNGRLRLAAVPGEEFRLDAEATRVDEACVRFCAHVTTRTRSDLIADGHPRAMIDDLPAYIASDRSADDARGGSDTPDTAPDRSTDLIEVWECYLQLDYDGDGVAEWRRVVTANGANERTILINEEWADGLPFTDLVPEPMPHTWQGRSLFDEVGDIQRVKTVLWRGINDNLYWTNNPQRTALKGGVDPSSMDELIKPTFEGVVWTTLPNAVSVLPVPFIADKLLAGMDLADRVREFRTGVSAATMSLDPETLQNQTAAAVNATKTAAYSKIEVYARNIAEYGGLKRLFAAILRLVVGNQDRERTIRLRGEWVDIDPRSWDAEMDVVVNVGLGSGSRDRDLAMLNAVAAKQELVVQGLGPMVAARLGIGPDVIFATYRQMVEAAGIKSSESYFPAITKQEVDALVQEMGSQPDPKTAETQAKIAAQQAEMQAKMQLQQAEAAGQMQLEQAKIAADQEAKQQQAALDWRNQQAQSAIDNDHRARELQAKANAAIEEIRLKHEAAEATARREFEYRLQELEAKTALKMRELELEAALKRETMEMHETASPNIEEAE